VDGVVDNGGTKAFIGHSMEEGMGDGGMNTFNEDPIDKGWHRWEWNGWFPDGPCEGVSY